MRHSIGLTGRTALLTGLMALVTLGAIAIAIAAFGDYQRVVSRLADEQTRTLTTASRLVQQSEGLVASGALLLVADSQFTRRSVMFDIQDRLDWVARLAMELEELRGETASFEEIHRVREQLAENLTALNALVGQRLQLAQRVGAAQARERLAERVAEVLHDNQRLSRDLSVAVGFHVSRLRAEMLASVAGLERQVARDDALLKGLAAGAVLTLLLTLGYIHRSVVGRIVSLQRVMSQPRPQAEQIPTRGSDELARVAQTLRRYLTRIHHNEQRILSMNRELEFLASHDALTQLHNRHFFDRTLNEQSVALANTEYAVAMIDIDHFKTINDTYGHDVGDRVICEVARRIRDEMPADALVARVGGEEFAVLTQQLTPEAFAERLETLRRAIAGRPIKASDQRITVTVSLGMSRKIPGADVQLCFKAADAALYEAKRRGRNRLIVRQLRDQDTRE